jgi:hypothetical protein
MRNDVVLGVHRDHGGAADEKTPLSVRRFRRRGKYNARE